MKMQASMPNIAQIKTEIIATLTAAGIHKVEARREADIIFEHVTGLTLADAVRDFDKLIPNEALACLRSILSQRMVRIPLQYCLGTTTFMGLKLEIKKGVFIPRPDTESLVEISLGLLRGIANPNIGEIGIGSGAISISLLKMLSHSQVTAVDISKKAILLSRHNAAKHGVSERLLLTCAHWESWLSHLKKPLNAIVTNPPYLCRQSRAAVQPEVSLWEPEVALYGAGDDGLNFYREFADKAMGRLSPYGFVAMEIGDGYAKDVTNIFVKAGWLNVTSHMDMNKLLRVVTAYREN